MSSTRTTTRASDAAWLRLVQASLTLGVVSLIVFAVVATFFTTISSGHFKYTADYWFTGIGLPIALAGIGHAHGVHRLQHGADGRRGTIGVWLYTLALTELFAELLASVLASAELRWGPAYPLCSLLAVIGLALLAAGSWRTGLVPRWMLGVWPVVWIIGSFFAQGPTPLLLAAFYVGFAVVLTRRVTARDRVEPVSGVAGAAVEKHA